MIENSRIKNYHNRSFLYTESFSKPGITAVFAFTKSRSILYNEILFYVVNTFFFFFFLLVEMRQCVSMSWRLKKTEQKQKIVTDISAHVWKMLLSSIGLT